MTTRRTTPTGMIRAGAILTRSGKIDYLRSDIGLDGEGTVTIDRTLESLGHPQTLDSLRGAPITLGHPETQVTPDNWSEHVVGAIAGEPQVAGDVITSDVLIGDATALKELDDGVAELSIGYGFTLDKSNMTTIGPLQVNHVALVPKGRAGPTVKVLDSIDGRKDSSMTKDEVQAAIDSAVQAATDAMSKQFKMDAAAEDRMRKGMMDALAPVADAVNDIGSQQKKMMEAADAEAKEKARAEAKDAAEKAAKELTDKVRAEERERYAILTDALPLIISDEDREKVKDADAKTILVTALADSVPNAADQSVDFLRGALVMAKASAADAAATFESRAQNLPNGVSPFVRDQHVTGAQDARMKAHDAYIEATSKRYTEAGGV